ncbi:MAG: hypothetical protein IRZ07_13740 [Microbispora sp.]|nr:hypothetical protein [Microbispora sp.]
MDRVWTWDRPLPLRWLLFDEYTDTPGIAMGVCADIDGLFVPPEPPPEPERFTLLGCDPAGPLRGRPGRRDYCRPSRRSRPTVRPSSS